METSTVQSIKLAIIAATSLSKDALHIYVGMAVFLATATVLRKQLRSIVPWLVVLVIASAGEVFDIRDDVTSLGYWRLGSSLHDILNTLFWPSVLVILAKLGFLSETASDSV